MNLDHIREQIPTSKKYVYLNHAACSPLPTPVVDAQNHYLEERSVEASVPYESWIEHTDKTRTLIADFIHARPEEIAFLKNTTDGINVVAHMLPYRKGDNVVTTDLEFPSNYLPWFNLQRKGVEFRVVRNKNNRLLCEDFEKAVNDHTKCLAVSHVEYATGFKNDLKALGDLCREHNTYFFVDPIQSLGALTMDVTKTPVDFFSSGCYKWLMSELGISVFYIRKDLLDEFHPADVGWFSLEDYLNYDTFDRENPQIATTARKFECGNINFYGVYTLHASLHFLRSFPMIEERVMRLSTYLMDQLKEKKYEIQTPEEHAGIVNFKVKNAEEVVEKLKKKNIIVSSRAGGIRVSTHFWNTEEELETLLRAL